MNVKLPQVIKLYFFTFSILRIFFMVIYFFKLILESCEVLYLKHFLEYCIVWHLKQVFTAEMPQKGLSLQTGFLRLQTIYLSCSLNT